MKSHYIVHLPHSGTDIPAEYADDYLLSKDELEQNVEQYCDKYTDKLFSKLYTKFGGVKNPYSRLFFDPERFGDDDKEAMHTKYRLGWFYENAILSQQPLRTTKNKDSIRKHYDEHHKLLNALTEQTLEEYEKCTIIDCHSFSNERYWFQDKDVELPDICIGYEEFHVDQNLVDIIKEEFKEFNVQINSPYQGSLVPTAYYKKDERVKSVMIEINKKLYLNDDNVSKNKNFNTIKKKLDNIFSKLDEMSWMKRALNTYYEVPYKELKQRYDDYQTKSRIELAAEIIAISILISMGIGLYVINNYYIGWIMIALSFLSTALYISDAKKASPGNMLSGIVLLPVIFMFIVGVLFIGFSDSEIGFIAQDTFLYSP